VGVGVGWVVKRGEERGADGHGGAGVMGARCAGRPAGLFQLGAGMLPGLNSRSESVHAKECGY
jgi:hypothetical protein